MELLNQIDTLIQDKGYNVGVLRNTINKYFELKGDRAQLQDYLQEVVSSYTEEEINAGSVATELALLNDLHYCVEIKGE